MNGYLVTINVTLTLFVVNKSIPKYYTNFEEQYLDPR